MFEDVLGYPNLEKLKRGRVEYVPSPITIWDKEMILIDELNRALPELQSKWLEIIRSRRIMGLRTRLMWVWAAMNPPSYAGTQALDEALLGRFALFVYPPEALEMSEGDRVKVTQTMAADDAPALRVWMGGDGPGDAPTTDLPGRSSGLDPSPSALLRAASRHFAHLRADLTQLPLFLSRLAELARGESQGQISLDGRRLGFLHRNILPYRSLELARAGMNSQSPLGPLVDSVRHVILSGIPLGLDETLLDGEKARHQLELCYDLLADFFKPDSELSRLDLIYELCTSRDPRRMVEILLSEDLGELARCRGWQTLLTGGENITSLAYIALTVEAHHPGTVPAEMLGGLSYTLSPGRLSSQALPQLVGEEIEYLDDIEALLAGAESDLERAIALERVRELTAGGGVSAQRIVETVEQIRRDLDWLGQLLKGENGP